MAAATKQALILDTDHLSEMDRRSSAGVELARRLEADTRIPGTTIISIDEQLRGLLSLIKQAKTDDQEIERYGRLHKSVIGASRMLILPWDKKAMVVFRQMQETGIRIGTLDLRIASITIAHGATLLTRNLKDFRRVPGLHVENWLSM